MFARLPGEELVELSVIFRRFLIHLRAASGKGVEHGIGGRMGHAAQGSGRPAAEMRN